MGKAADLKIKATSDSKQAESALSRISGQLNGISKLPRIDRICGRAWRVDQCNRHGDSCGTEGLCGNQAVCRPFTLCKPRLSFVYRVPLGATGNQIGMNATELGKMASELQKVTRFGDEAILPMQQIFIATQKLTKDQLPRVIELALGYG